MAVNNIIKRIQNIMRSDAGINGDAQRIEQMVWMFFLKVYDTQEEVWEYNAYRDKKEFTSIIPEELRWRNWAVDEKDGSAMTGDELLDFINTQLFPQLKSIPVSAETPRHQSIVHEVFQDINQYMKNGTLLRQIINIVNEIEFDDADDRHTFGDIYEGLLKDLQSAGNAGEFYTPRALTDFIVQQLNPKLGETFGDFTSGTGGFLTSALNFMAPSVKSAGDQELLQRAVVGQEWKPLPYLLSITNLLVHDIEAPNIRHCDSLGTNMSDFKESDKVDVIGMNPPYGGSTDASVKGNFPSQFQSSETADLFIVLIMNRLKAGGRAGVIIPDGFLFGTDGAKRAIKEALLRKFNLHTIIRLPGSIFSPYTSIATNILFFDNETADCASEGFRTKDVWFYRMDMPEGYKHFNKTKPMRLEHTTPITEWWKNRNEIFSEEVGEKSRIFSAQDLLNMDCNFDQCKFPKEEEEVLPPDNLINDFTSKSTIYFNAIDSVMRNISDSIKGRTANTFSKSIDNPYKKLSDLVTKIPEALRKSILQEAIMGKLVPQDPNEEPASELLARIKKEKEKLVKEGKLKKKDLTLSPITDDEKGFDIPDNWVWCRLGDVGIFERGNGIKRDETRAEGYPCVRYGEMYTVYRKKATFDKTTSFTTKEVFEKCRKAYKGDLFMALTGENKQDIALAAQYTGDEVIAVGGDLCHFTVIEAFALYFVYLVNSPYYSSKKEVLATGDIIVHISADKLGSIPVPLPPLSEQKRIVNKIEEIFSILK